MAALVPLPSGLTVSVLAVHDGPFDAVLDVGRVVGRAEHPLVVGLVPGHQHRHRLVGVEPADAEVALLGDDGAHPLAVGVDVQRGLLVAARPGPGVPEPERGQHVQPRLLGSPVVHGDLHEKVFRGVLRVFDEDVEVAVVVEDPGVDQLVLGLGLAARPVGGEQVVVGELALRVLVEHLQVRRRRRRVEVVVALLDVLAVVALGVGQAEEPLLERSGRARSTAPPTGTAAACHRRCPPARPRPTGRPGSPPDRRGTPPRCCRGPGRGPPGPSPTDAR